MTREPAITTRWSNASIACVATSAGVLAPTARLKASHILPEAASPASNQPIGRTRLAASSSIGTIRQDGCDWRITAPASATT